MKWINVQLITLFSCSWIHLANAEIEEEIIILYYYKFTLMYRNYRKSVETFHDISEYQTAAYFDWSYTVCTTDSDNS